MAAGTYKLLSFWKLASRDPSQQVAELSKELRERPDGEALWSGIVNAAQTAVFLRARDLKADFSDAGKYLAFYKGALEVAFFLMLVARNMPLPWELIIERWHGVGRRRRSGTTWAVQSGCTPIVWSPLRISSLAPLL